MARVHQFDPGSRGRCVNSSITGDTSQAVSRAAHPSLFAAPGSSQKHRVSSRAGPLQGAREQILPGLTPHSWAVTPDRSGWQGAKGALRVGGQWRLMCVYMCALPVPLECTGVELSASLCKTLKPIQCHYERLESSVGLAFVCRLHLDRTCCIGQSTSHMIMHIMPEIPRGLSILNRSLNCWWIMNWRRTTTNFPPVNHGCLRPNDLVVTNYALNVKSSTFLDGKGWSGCGLGWPTGKLYGPKLKA